MNDRTREYVNRAAKIVAQFPDITKAVVVGPAMNDDFAFGDCNVWLAVFTKPEAKYTKVCCDLNAAFGDNDLARIDIYMTADEDFYAEVYSLIDSGEVIYERG